MTLCSGSCHSEIPPSQGEAHLCHWAAHSVPKTRLQVTAVFFTCTDLTLQWRGGTWNAAAARPHAQTIKKIMEPICQISTYFFNAHVRSHALHVIHTASSLPYTLLLPTQDLDMEIKSG